MSHTVATDRTSFPVFPAPAATTPRASAGLTASSIDDDTFVPLVFTQRAETPADRTRRTVRRWIRRLRQPPIRITFER